MDEVKEIKTRVGNLCPIMTRDINNPQWCNRSCACLAFNDLYKIRYEWCGMMPSDGAV